ncbi:MAG: hypothetical protein TE42_08110 [Candidatus Synechococcus spongiarum SP3]|uniref:Uncharacterized protein n=1 Tax=Candidatus Synechococcus spongiarum SP3 TaxID=1604020 RepID=A0A0G2HJQ0_9SYNE|nr:MAG: hypothetical protein TE42_08110 [Candidatus Synechococcus spongiarum SP3]
MQRQNPALAILQVFTRPNQRSEPRGSLRFRLQRLILLLSTAGKKRAEFLAPDESQAINRNL